MNPRPTLHESCPRLPFEIIDCIIDEIHRAGDKLSLRNFALVSQGLVYRCQRLLFHTIDLTDKVIPGDQYYRRFYRIVQRCPKIRPYVCIFNLVDTFIWDQEPKPSWVLEEDTIPIILPLLPNLHSFHLSFNTGVKMWHCFRPAIQRALLELASRPSVRFYTLGSIHAFPPESVHLLAAKRRLKLDAFVVDSSSLQANDPPSFLRDASQPSLESLSLEFPSASTIYVLQQLLQSFPTPTLRHLRIRQVDVNDAPLIEQLWCLIQSQAPSIQRLVWRPLIWKKSVAYRPPSPIDLSVLSHLQTLQFPVNFHSSDDPGFGQVLPLLEQIAKGCLKTLIVECMFVKPVELLARSSDWAALDAVLTSASFGGLQKVVFCGPFMAVPSLLRDSARRILLGQLPLAREKGVTIVVDVDLCS